MPFAGISQSNSKTSKEDTICLPVTTVVAMVKDATRGREYGKAVEVYKQNDSLHQVKERRWDSIYNRMLSEKQDFNAVISRLNLNLQEKDGIIAIKNKEIRDVKKAARKQKLKIILVGLALLGAAIAIK